MRPVLRLLLAVATATSAAPAPSQAQTFDDRGLVVEQPASETVELNLPENLPLKVLLDFVSEKLALNILYDEDIAAQRVTLRAQGALPNESLRGVLESVLQAKGYALVATEQPQWLRVVQSKDLASTAALVAGEGIRPPDAMVVTQIFRLLHTSSSDVSQLIRPFMTQPGGSVVAVSGQPLLIVTDFAGNIERLATLIRLVDSPGRKVDVELVPVAHMPAEELASKLGQLLDAQAAEQGATEKRLLVTADKRTNRLVVVGAAQELHSAIELARAIDVPLPLETRSYRFSAVHPRRLDTLIRELIGPADVERQYRSAIDIESGLMIVSAPAEVHEQLDHLKSSIDVSGDAGQSPMRFYKLMNTTAAKVLRTIAALEGGGTATIPTHAPLTDAGLSTGPRDAAFVAGSAGGALYQSESFGTRGAVGARGVGASDYSEGRGYLSSREAEGVYGNDRAAAAVPLGVQGEGFRLAADENTNSIIVVAEPQAQEMYRQLIQALDQRRPQVLIEVTLVTVDASKSRLWGTELGFSPGNAILYSQFGFSTADPLTGTLSPQAGRGFNGALLRSDVAQVVIRALETRAQSRVLSAPKILVNDHAEGVLTSINEAPFVSLNSSDEIATTSFGGYAQAGTTITIVPHISEGDHLHLEYAVELNSFRGESDEGIPPPRQTSAVTSEVTIPDGYTVVIGGLKRADSSTAKSTIPLLGEIPLIKHLFSSNEIDDVDSSLYVFIRPTILRSDKFEDLKYLSDRDLDTIGLERNFPSSIPLGMELGT